MASPTDLAEAARQRLAEIEAESIKLKEYLRLHDELMALGLGMGARTLMAGEPSLSSTPESDPEPDQTPRKRVTDNPKPAVVIREAVKILRSHGRPMSRRELHEALSAKGIEVKGVDPIKALGTMLWRGKAELVQIEGHGYWPRSDSYKLAGYEGDLHGLFGEEEGGEDY